MTRKTKPALYELIQIRLGARPAPVADDSEHADPHVAGDLSLGGRAIRVPVGYFFVGIPVMLLVILGAYLLGYENAESSVEARFSAQLLEQLRANEQARLVLDPLTQQPKFITPETPESTGAGGGASGGGGSASAPGGTPVGTTGKAAILRDPRVSGLNYLLLKHLPEDEAVELARFCRARDLDAFVIPRHNARSRLLKVIVLPGIEAGALQGAAATDLKRRVKDVGLGWKLSGPGRDHLGDSYFERFDG